MRRSSLTPSPFVRLALGAALSLAACGRSETRLTVAADEARACDVLLDTGNAGSPTVDFGRDVHGASSQKGARLGISWASAADAPFHPRSVVLHGAATPKILTSTCFDRDGRPVANPNVKLL